MSEEEKPKQLSRDTHGHVDRDDIIAKRPNAIRTLLEGFTAKPGPGEFQCACCKKIFKKGWSDEEALAEKNADFPDDVVEECVLVCDDCYEQLRKEYPHEFSNRS